MDALQGLVMHVVSVCLVSCFLTTPYFHVHVWMFVNFISPRRLKRGGWAGVPNCLCVFAPPNRGVALFSQPFANTGGRNMDEPNVGVMYQVTRVTNETHSHVVVCTS